MGFTQTRQNQKRAASTATAKTSTPARKTAGVSFSEVLKKWQGSCPLRVFRKAKGITLTQASAVIGVSVTSIQFWESGTREPKPANFKAIASFMRKHCDAKDRSAADLKTTESIWRKWLETKPR